MRYIEGGGVTFQIIPPMNSDSNESNNNSGGNGNRVIKYRRLRPFKTAEIKVLLLENISSVALKILKEAGYQVSHFVIFKGS